MNYNIHQGMLKFLVTRLYRCEAFLSNKEYAGGEDKLW